MRDAGRAPEVDFDVLGHRTLAANDAAWAGLRDCPVAWTPHNGGHWVISGYEAVAEAFSKRWTSTAARDARQGCLDGIAETASAQ